MLPKTKFEQELLNEVKDLAQADLARIVKLVHFVKNEMLGKETESAKLKILGCAGMLQDLTSEEADIFNEAIKRKSLFSGREFRL